MVKYSVFCIAKTDTQAEQIIDKLKAAGFSNNDVSVLFPEQESGGGLTPAKSAKASEGAILGANTGGFAGGALGWIAGLGVLAIPGVAPLIAAGPVVAAITGFALGGTGGGIAGGLIGLGVPEIEAKRYEEKIKHGNVLISIHAENTDDIKRAKSLFHRLDAADICTTGETATPKDSPASEDVEGARRGAVASHH